MATEEMVGQQREKGSGDSNKHTLSMWATRERERQTDRLTDRENHRDTERQREIEIN